MNDQEQSIENTAPTQMGQQTIPTHEPKEILQDDVEMKDTSNIENTATNNDDNNDDSKVKTNSVDDEPMVDTMATEKTENIMDATTTMIEQNQMEDTKDANAEQPPPKDSNTNQTNEATKITPPNIEGQKLGGEIEKDAYALLAGQYEDTKENTKSVLNVPLTVLPAILGRTQKTTDEHVFDLGNCKALSRKHAVIFYSDSFGGKVGKYTQEAEGAKYHKIDDELVYIPPLQNKVLRTEDVIRPRGVDLPQAGFYAIECISKNKLMINGRRVDQGQIALLQHGSTIRMAGYYLYFVLPENDVAAKTVSVPHPIHDRNFDSDDDGENSPPAKKSRRDGRDLCEGKSVTELIEEFINAVDSDIFERRHSLISGHILFHAVQDVARSQEMQDISRRENGISRSEIMQWIDKNELYAKWVIKMLTKLETKSYQANLSKALIKAGFTRIGTTGRHVKWLLPPVRSTVASEDTEIANKTMMEDIMDEGTETKDDSLKDNGANEDKVNDVSEEAKDEEENSIEKANE